MAIIAYVCLALAIFWTFIIFVYAFAIGLDNEAPIWLFPVGMSIVIVMIGVCVFVGQWANSLA